MRGNAIITSLLFAILAVVFFSISYVVPSDQRIYTLGAALIPFGLMIVSLIKS